MNVNLYPALIERSSVFKNLLNHNGDGNIEIPFEKQTIDDLNDFLTGKIPIESIQNYENVYRLADYLDISGFASFEKYKDDVGLQKLFEQEKEDFLLEEELRSQYSRDHVPDYKLINFFEETLPTKIDEIPGIIKKSPNKFEIVGNLTAFRSNLKRFGMWQLKNWNNLVLAGGSVTRCLEKLPDQDSDEEDETFPEASFEFFIHGVSEKIAIDMIQNFIVALGNYIWIVRSENTITIRTVGTYFSFILRIYRNPLEVLLGFDLDSCKCLYNGENILMLPSCIRSLTHRYNLVRGNSERINNTTFEDRIYKYFNCGFSVRTPNFTWDKINAKIFVETPRKGLARLLNLLTGKYKELPLLNEIGSLDLAHEKWGWHHTGRKFIIIDNVFPSLLKKYKEKLNFVFIDNRMTVNLLFDNKNWYSEMKSLLKGSFLFGLAGRDVRYASIYQAIVGDREDFEIQSPTVKEFSFMKGNLKLFKSNSDWFDDAYCKEY